MELDMLAETQKQTLEEKVKEQRTKVQQVEQKIRPLPNLTDQTVLHKTFGPGKVLACAQGRIIIDFHGKKKKFLYPQAFQQGFLQTNTPAEMEIFQENAVLEAQLDTLFQEISREETQLDNLIAIAN